MGFLGDGQVVTTRHTVPDFCVHFNATSIYAIGSVHYVMSRKNVIVITITGC